MPHVIPLVITSGSCGYCSGRTVMSSEEKSFLCVIEHVLFTELQQYIFVIKSSRFDKFHCVMLVLMTSLKEDVDDWF